MSRKKKVKEAAGTEAAVEQPPEEISQEVTAEQPVEESSEAPAVVEAIVEEAPVSEEPVAQEEEAVEEIVPGGFVPRWRLGQVLEAVLFASPKPCTTKELLATLKGAAAAFPENQDVTAFAKLKEAALVKVLDELAKELAAAERTYDLTETAAGWQLVTRPDFAPWLRQLYPENRSARLSAPAMETLAIIAYRQPITRADIEAVRGVAVDGVMQTLLDRGLIKIAGRSEIPGRPLLYDTTQFFMEHFGLRDLDELPNAEELRKIALPQAPIPEAPAEPAKETPAETPQPEGAAPETATEESPQPAEPAVGESEASSAEAVTDEPSQSPEPAAPEPEAIVEAAEPEPVVEEPAPVEEPETTAEAEPAEDESEASKQ
jgi:segregation and condensation protein B